MEHFQITELDARRTQQGKSYVEFLRSANLSAGIYVLRAGDEDLQQPHTEDEVYYVTQGRGRFRAGESDVAVHAGSFLFVPAGERHRFHQIEEDLTVLVLFAPPEGGLA